MSVYVLTGRLGSGKTLLAVSRIKHALLAGRRVATNLDLNLDKLLPAANKTADVTRLPDKPTATDLNNLGMGAPVLDESKYGLIVLDELAAWLNSRQWGDKERQALVDWLVHSRKKRWDIIFIVQHLNMVDKQIREALAEYVVTCKRLDKVKVPIIGPVGKVLTLGAWDGRIGKVHMGVVVYAAGSTPQSPLVVDRWIYRGLDLYPAYDTEQVFTSNNPELVRVGMSQEPYRLLPPWHTTGRYLVTMPTWRERLSHLWAGSPRAALPECKLKLKLPATVALMALPASKRMAAARVLLARADGVRVAAMPAQWSAS